MEWLDGENNRRFSPSEACAPRVNIELGVQGGFGFTCTIDAGRRFFLRQRSEDNFECVCFFSPRGRLSVNDCRYQHRSQYTNIG